MAGIKSTVNTPLSLLHTRDLLIELFKLSKDQIHQALAQNVRQIIYNKTSNLSY